VKAPEPYGETPASSDLLRMLDLEELDRDLYRARHVFRDRYALYGGQVAAQALRAAGGTVEPDRLPHSLHGYFLRAGDSSRPTIFRVYRDRDGKSYSARRVVALQGGEVIFNMAASFHVSEDGPDSQVHDMPTDVEDPDTGTSYAIPRLFGMEGRRSGPPKDGEAYPTRFWARCTVPLGDDVMMHNCVLTYLSDISTGLFQLAGPEGGPGSSLDHAVWFHRPLRLDDWVLVDLVPHTVARGRGWYTGRVMARDGRLGASLAQETLFRPPRNPPAQA
jgi:acyl-CoA thioesterase-2